MKVTTWEDPSEEEWASWDDAKKRQWLATRFLYEARGLLDDIHKSYLIVGFSNGQTKRVRVRRPPSNSKKDLMIAAAVAIDKHEKLVRMDSADRGLAAVDNWVHGLIHGDTPVG